AAMTETCGTVGRGAHAVGEVPSWDTFGHRVRRGRVRPSAEGDVPRGARADGGGDPGRGRPTPRSGPAVEGRVRREELRRARGGDGRGGARRADHLHQAVDVRDRTG